MDNNGFISKDELTELFRAANLPLPGYRVREIVQEMTKTSEQLSFHQFTEVSPQVKGQTHTHRELEQQFTVGAAAGGDTTV